MGSVMMPNPGVSALDHTISSAAPKVQTRLQLQEANGKLGTARVFTSFPDTTRRIGPLF